MFIDRLISVIAPHHCLGCGREGELVCAWCWPDLADPKPSTCFRCNTLTRDYLTCSSCRSATNLSRVWVVGEYEGALKLLIQQLKYQRAISAAALLSKLVDESLPFVSVDYVTYVPTASSRVRRRGFDHIQQIALDFASHRGLGLRPLLARIGQSRQVGTRQSMRKLQANGAYYACASQHIAGARILIIDDVLTSGATLNACADVLKAAGARSIQAAVLAKH